jgi:hypothetical protein
MSENTPAPTESSIAKALTLAIMDTEPLGKESFNNWHKYAYTSMESILDAGRKAMAKYGLSARRCGYHVEWDRAENGEPIAGILVNKFVLEHTSGEKREAQAVWPFYTEKGRTIEKALAGALTTSLGYWIRDLLLLPRQDAAEPKMDESDDRGYTPPPRRNASPKPEPKPEPHHEPAPPPKPEMAAGWPPVAAGRLGSEFADHAERQLALAAMTVADLTKVLAERGVAPERFAGKMAAWDPALGPGISQFVETRRRKMDSSRSAVPTKEAARANADTITKGPDVPAEAQGGNGTTESAAAPKVEGPAASPVVLNPRSWPVPVGKKTAISPATAIYWQNAITLIISTILAESGHGDETANVLAKLEARFGIDKANPEAMAITLYKGLHSKLTDPDTARALVREIAPQPETTHAE